MDEKKYEKIVTRLKHKVDFEMLQMETGFDSILWELERDGGQDEDVKRLYSDFIEYAKTCFNKTFVKENSNGR